MEELKTDKVDWPLRELKRCLQVHQLQSTSIFYSPISSGVLVFFFVCFKQTRYFRNKGVVWIGVRQQWADW